LLRNDWTEHRNTLYSSVTERKKEPNYQDVTAINYGEKVVIDNLRQPDSRSGVASQRDFS
jgi:hypothetical protein